MPERRSSPRLKGYDYSLPGWYFVTINTAEKKCVFGEVVDGEVALNQAGEIVRDAWLDVPNHYTYVQLDEFVVMPNHIHGIVIFLEEDEEKDGLGRDRFINLSLRKKLKRPGLSEVIRGFKTWSARRINEVRGTAGLPVWQRSFYERLIWEEQDSTNAYSFLGVHE